jgi:hypothetical protein
LNFRISRGPWAAKSKKNLWSDVSGALEWLLLAVDTQGEPPSVFFFEIVLQTQLNFAADATPSRIFKPQQSQISGGVVCRSIKGIPEGE